MKGLIRIIALFLTVGLLAGCGKNIPSIDPALLQSKPSLLVVTEPNLAPDTKQRLQAALVDWRDHHQTAFDWFADVSTLSEEQLEAIRFHAYDYIVVAGHELVQATLPQAEQIGNRKWILLDDQVVRQTLSIQGSHIMVKSVLESQLRGEWDEWVRQQLVSDRAIEWVTTSAYPIPSEWAPSEEAEYVSLADAEGWYSQLQFQVRSHGPAWIVVFAPLEKSQLQRIRGLQVPVVNMAQTTVELNWNEILVTLRNNLSNQAWTPGLQPYEQREAVVKKNF